MDPDEIERRKRLTFAQAEGVDPLPSQLKVGEISDKLRAILWAFYFDWMKDCERFEELRDPLLEAHYVYFVKECAMMSDEISQSFNWHKRHIKKIFQNGDYVLLLGFIQSVLRSTSNESFSKNVAYALNAERAAYRIVDRFTIVPIASETDGQTLQGAFESLKSAGEKGARQHLLRASSYLTEGHYADSVRESIHAVESLVRRKTGKDGFADAIRVFIKDAGVHGAFGSALVKLYGYASDEPGIRHPLLEKGDSNVAERDALFMLGISSAFITYALADS